MKLYDLELSGNCHKIRLMLGLLSLDYTKETLQLDDPTTEAFSKINPRHQVPVLEDEGEIVWDSMAILVYIARRYASPEWLPLDPLPLGRVMQWLAVSQNEILFGIARARAVLKLGRPFDLPSCQEMGRQGLATLETCLSGSEWLASENHPTIADIACYPYIALSPEAGLSLTDFPGIRAWLRRIQALPGYVGMKGIEAY